MSDPEAVQLLLDAVARASTLATHVVAVPATVLWASPDAPAGDDDAAVSDTPDLGAWAAAYDTEKRFTLARRAETHAVLGEPVVVVEDRGSWSFVELLLQPSQKGGHGYPGWIPTAHLAPYRRLDRPAVVVETPAEHPGRVSIGALVDVVERSTSLTTVRRPDGRESVLPSTSVRPLDEPPGDARAALATARTFTGSMYLWAGSSAAGVDCSGLVHLAYRTAGIVVPRDADDQECAVEAIPLDEAGEGDLVFYASATGVHHVGLATGHGTTLHSSRTGQPVGPGLSTGEGYPGDVITAGSVRPGRLQRGAGHPRGGSLE